MNERVKRLSEEIRKLSPEEQATLVDEVLENFHGVDPRIEKAWAKEAQRRWQAHLRGEVQPIPADKVFARLGKKHGESR